MIDDLTPLHKRAAFWRFFTVCALFFAFMFSFWNELIPAARGFWNLGAILIGNGFNLFNDTVREQAFLSGGFDTTVLNAMVKVGGNFIIYFLLYFISLLIVSQFTLPVELWKDRKSAFVTLLNYGLGRYGLTAFVREGKLIAKTREDETLNPGVLLVDLSSAVVLASQPWEEEVASTVRPSQFHGLKKENTIFRVVGPGVNFIRAGERVRSVLDLRKQIRMTPGVKAITRDGIEIETSVFTVFSVSEPSDVIPVAYMDGSDAGHLFALEISESKQAKTIEIKRKWKLDRQDAEEIHRAVSAGTVRLSDVFSSLPAYNKTITPYLFDKNRIFNASCAGALNSSKSNDAISWDELTQPICIDIFQSLLSHYTYDYLFSLNSLVEMQPASRHSGDEKRDRELAEFLKTLKAELSFRMRCQGILAYKVLKLRTTEGPESPDGILWNEFSSDDRRLACNEVYPVEKLSISNPYILTNSKVIRDRGIKIIAAGFTQIISPPEVRRQVIENWKARSEREIDITLAKYERDAMQVINNARTQTQRENAYHLSGIFNKGEHSDEALALLIFQALENIATNPKSRKDIPPREILGMLQNLHRWLLTERKEIFKPPKTSTGKGGEDDQ